MELADVVIEVSSAKSKSCIHGNYIQACKGVIMRTEWHAIESQVIDRGISEMIFFSCGCELEVNYAKTIKKATVTVAQSNRMNLPNSKYDQTFINGLRLLVHCPKIETIETGIVPKKYSMITTSGTYLTKRFMQGLRLLKK